MTEYLIQKNWKGIVWMVLLYLMCRYTFDTPGEVMNGFVCIFIFFWIMRVIFAGNGPKAVVMIGGLFGLVRFIWYVCSLKPLRRLIFRMFYLGAQQQPYPYLALYGSLLDTHVMMYKLSVAFYRDKTPVVRAAMWRLLARGVIQLGTDAEGKAAIKLGQWVDSPSDGLDQSLEKSLYTFLEQSKSKDGVVNPSEVRKVMTHGYKRKGFFFSRKGTGRRDYNNDNQYHFADLLNTGISLKAYSKRDVRNIYGMKRFLSHLSKYYGKYVEPELTNASATDVEMPEISRVWPEYMAFAYLFGMEKSVFQQITRMLPTDGNDHPLLSQLTHSPLHLRAWRKLLYQVSVATPGVEDAVAGKIGLLPLAWHANEIYDI